MWVIIRSLQCKYRHILPSSVPWREILRLRHGRMRPPFPESKITELMVHPPLAQMVWSSLQQIPPHQKCNYTDKKATTKSESILSLFKKKRVLNYKNVENDCDLTSFSMSWTDFMRMLFIWEFWVRNRDRETERKNVTKKKNWTESIHLNEIHNVRRTVLLAWMLNLGWRLKGTPSRAAENEGK